MKNTIIEIIGTIILVVYLYNKIHQKLNEQIPIVDESKENETTKTTKYSLKSNEILI